MAFSFSIFKKARKFAECVNFIPPQIRNVCIFLLCTVFGIGVSTHSYDNSDLLGVSLLKKDI
jgi:hypothetical protein